MVYSAGLRFRRFFEPPLHAFHFLVLGTVVASSLASEEVIPASRSTQEASREATRLIVKLKDGAGSLRRLTSSGDYLGLNVENCFVNVTTLKSMPLEILSFANTCGRSVGAICSSLLHRGLVEICEADVQVRTSSQDLGDPLLDELYGLRQMQVPEAWEIHRGGDNNITVAIIDTGIDLQHPDLVGNLWTNPGEIPGNGIDDDGNGFVDDVHGWNFVDSNSPPVDDNGHGTHCAGIVGAAHDNGRGVAGVSSGVKLMALKSLDRDGYGGVSAAVEALDYALLMGARVSSNSWGCAGCFSPALNELLNFALNKSHIFIASAGNDGYNNDARPHYPCAHEQPNVICVASSDGRGRRSSYSNFGRRTTDVFAPGDYIASTSIGGGYTNLSGTSTAGPYVAGLAALIYDFRPDLPFRDVRSAILTTVDILPDLTNKVASGGRINAKKALESLLRKETMQSLQDLILIMMGVAIGLMLVGIVVLGKCAFWPAKIEQPEISRHPSYMSDASDISPVAGDADAPPQLPVNVPKGSTIGDAVMRYMKLFRQQQQHEAGMAPGSTEDTPRTSRLKLPLASFANARLAVANLAAASPSFASVRSAAARLASASPSVTSASVRSAAARFAAASPGVGSASAALSSWAAASPWSKRRSVSGEHGLSSPDAGDMSRSIPVRLAAASPANLRFAASLAAGAPWRKQRSSLQKARTCSPTVDVADTEHGPSTPKERTPATPAAELDTIKLRDACEDSVGGGSGRELVSDDSCSETDGPTFAV